jgi:hypothetical protein
MDRKCDKCGATLGEDSLFCTSCGAEVKTVQSATTETAHKIEEVSPIGGLRWKWVFISIGMILLIQFALGIAAAIFIGITEGSAEQPVLMTVLAMISFFLGAMWAAYKSPGLTIKEPAIGSAIWVSVTALVMRNISGVIFGWVLPFLFALAGAKLGERISRKKTGS